MAFAVHRTQNVYAGASTGGITLKATETQSAAIALVKATDLKEIIRKIFNAAGSDDSEASIVANHLVEANLAGHDSHGVTVAILFRRLILLMLKGSPRGIRMLFTLILREQSCRSVVTKASDLLSSGKFLPAL
jgi:hypothetical protein